MDARQQRPRTQCALEILLPAGTIQIPTTWYLPSNTRLVGQGENNALSSTPGTTIQAAVPLLASMIQFGSSTSACTSSGCSGISVEKLTLDGKAQSIDGIINQLSQNNTYVDHVTIYQVLGTGLLISSTSGGSASNSGPYTNITFDTGIYSGTNSTVCAAISNVSGGLTGTKGIHGLRCKSENQDAPAAVLLGWPVRLPLGLHETTSRFLATLGMTIVARNDNG